MIYKVYGAAGGGKTHTLLDIIDKHLSEGVQPEEIGFISFTNVAVDEAITRAHTKFSLPKKRFRYFRTLHSLAFACIHATGGMTMNSKALNDFGKLAGYTFNGTFDNSGFYTGQTKDDKILSMYIVGRERAVDVASIYDAGEMNVDKYTYLNLVNRYEAYKKKKGYIDFNDMVTQAAEVPVLPSFKLLMLDEAQDFSTAQWKFIDRLIANAEDVYLAGDDLQAIYTWRAADVARFIDYPAESILLEQSHRVPRKLQAFAKYCAEDNIVNKLERTCKPREAEGQLHYVTKLTSSVFKPKGSYLILARNQYYLQKVFMLLRDLGVPATYGDMTNVSKDMAIKVRAYVEDGTEPVFENTDDWYFFRYCQENGTVADILQPRVVCSTIHGAKGAEADNVILLTMMTARSRKEKDTDPDAYYRLLYVALTRAKNRLVIFDPKSKHKYFEEVNLQCGTA